MQRLTWATLQVIRSIFSRNHQRSILRFQCSLCVRNSLQGLKKTYLILCKGEANYFAIQCTHIVKLLEVTISQLESCSLSHTHTLFAGDNNAHSFFYDSISNLIIKLIESLTLYRRQRFYSFNLFIINDFFIGLCEKVCTTFELDIIARWYCCYIDMPLLLLWPPQSQRTRF